MPRTITHRRTPGTSAFRLRSCLLAGIVLIASALPARATPLLDHVFSLEASDAVPMDIQSMELALSFDAVARRATGTAIIVFEAPAAGRPYFKMKAPPGNARLDGLAVEVTEVDLPDRAANVRVLSAAVEAATTHTLELTYNLSRREVRLGGGRVGFLTAMRDIGSRGNYFEAYGPSNVEADAYALTLILSVEGARELPRLFANGQIELLTDTPATWQVTFPAWYTTSSFYVHLTNGRLHVLEGTVPGVERSIPVTVYGRSLRRIADAMAAIPGIFAELEATYGPYLHGSFVALISGRGGMEHCGATVTSLWALGHEITHSWFARGVMPTTGRDGWMDEAIASWRDYGYPRYTPEPSRGLATSSPAGDEASGHPPRLTRREIRRLR